MASAPLFSIVVECGTRTLSNAIPFRRMVEGYLAEARATLPDSKFEFLFVGKGLPDIRLPKNCRKIELKTGYYGFKNGGSRLARGRYVVFWDSDCRAEKGYLKTALKTFEENPKAIALAGKTRYDASHYLSLLNTVLSFGPYYNRAEKYLTRQSVLTHNVTIRRSAFPKEPFGPFEGRAGGDSFITRYAEKKGSPFLLVQELKIYHEDPSFNPIILFERHLRDVYQPLDKSGLKSKSLAGLRALWNVPVLSLKRFRRVLLFGPQAGMGIGGVMAAIPVLVFYGLIDFLAVLGMIVYQPWLTRWLGFQFGPQWLKIRGWA